MLEAAQRNVAVTNGTIEHNLKLLGGKPSGLWPIQLFCNHALHFLSSFSQGLTLY